MLGTSDQFYNEFTSFFNDLSTSPGHQLYRNFKKYQKEMGQLFGVQNEVNILLLEIEKRKLNILKQKHIYSLELKGNIRLLATML